AESMLDPLVDLFDALILTTPDSDRGRRPETLVETVERLGTRSPRVVEGDVEAIESALRMTDIPSIVVCGSLYLAGTALRVLDRFTSPSE
ncbi:MAG: hypothetical protein R3338_04960, partial [Thermoanaerobaculia bacterium]|nr:hypothetical protein [Thermoanaerobaculia bacterium]